MMIRAIIVDDEQGTIETLKALIKDVCPEILIIGEATNTDLARQLIIHYKPDLIFLDINMTFGSGLGLVKQITPFPSKIIFMTASQKSTLEAVRLSGLDYLLKPFDEEELLVAVNRFKRRDQLHSLNMLSDILRDKEVKRIAVSGLDDIRVIDIKDICYILSDRRNSIFSLVDQSQVVADKPLGEYESLLGSRGFLRINRFVLVHLRYIKRYISGEVGSVLLLNGETFEVARTRKKLLMEHLTGH